MCRYFARISFVFVFTGRTDLSKGNQVNIPEPGTWIWCYAPKRQRKRTRRRLREAREELSFLFNMSVYPGIGLSGDRVTIDWESTLRLEVSGALSDGP